MTQPLALILTGAIALATIIVALFFLRFWHSTKDRFFLFFAASFLIEGINRIALGLNPGADEDTTIYYVVRFISYMLIVVAIIDKNVGSKRRE